MDSKPLCKVRNACLCCAVSWDLGQRRIRIHGRNIQNIPVTQLYHIACKFLCGQKRTLDIQVKHGREPLNRQVKETLLGFIKQGVHRKIFVICGCSRVISSSTVNQNFTFSVFAQHHFVRGFYAFRMPVLVLNLRKIQCALLHLLTYLLAIFLPKKKCTIVQ